MMVLVLAVPPLALLPLLSNFRRAFPAMEEYRRQRLRLAAGVMTLFWVLAFVLAMVVVFVPGGAGRA
jgi:hypothetical protein